MIYILNQVAIKCINLLIVSATIIFVAIVGITLVLLAWHALGIFTRWVRHEIWKLQRR